MPVILERVYNPSVSYFISLRGGVILSFLSCQISISDCHAIVRIGGVIFPVHGLFLEVPSRCRHFLHCTNAGMRARQDDTKN